MPFRGPPLRCKRGLPDAPRPASRRCSLRRQPFRRGPARRTAWGSRMLRAGRAPPTGCCSLAITSVAQRARCPPAGLAWTAVQENPHVRELLDVLSLSVDRGGQVYVSTFEARDYPIYGTQW